LANEKILKENLEVPQIMPNILCYTPQFRAKGSKKLMAAFHYRQSDHTAFREVLLLCAVVVIFSASVRKFPHSSQ
jgi:hypothetical protein